jgi:hypothetical protein
VATPTPRPLITNSQLLEWLGVSERWLRDRRKTDPDFPVIDIANPGSTRENPRYDVEAVAKHLGIPIPPREASDRHSPAA